MNFLFQQFLDDLHAKPQGQTKNIRLKPWDAMPTRSYLTEYSLMTERRFLPIKFRTGDCTSGNKFQTILNPSMQRAKLHPLKTLGFIENNQNNDLSFVVGYITNSLNSNKLFRIDLCNYY